MSESIGEALREGCEKRISGGGREIFFDQMRMGIIFGKGVRKGLGWTLIFGPCLEDHRGHRCLGVREFRQEEIDRSIYPFIQILTVQEHRRKNQAEDAGHISQPVGLFVHPWRILFGVVMTDALFRKAAKRDRAKKIDGIRCSVFFLKKCLIL